MGAPHSHVGQAAKIRWADERGNDERISREAEGEGGQVSAVCEKKVLSLHSDL